MGNFHQGGQTGILNLITLKGELSDIYETQEALTLKVNVHHYGKKESKFNESAPNFLPLLP